LTTTQKVALVESVWETYGLAPALAAVDLPKSTWYYQRQQAVDYETKYAHLLPVLQDIARQHPAYGYRRTTVELRDTHGLQVNQKVVRRLHQLWDLRLLRSIRRPKPSGIQQAIQDTGSRINLVAQLERIGLFQVLYTDFTELWFADGRQKAHLIPIIEHRSKLAFGWAIGPSPDAALALQAWARAKQTCQQLAISCAGLIMHHDQGGAFISYDWAQQLLLADGLRLSYTWRGPQDNPEMEAFNSRFKNENRSLFLDAQTLAELAILVDQRMHYYNHERRHSALGYLAPWTYIERVRAGQVTLE
jgi:putative transposase